VPLRFQQRVIGVLTVQSYRPNAYSQDSVDLLMSLSAPLAVVIENARLFETVEQRRKELAQSLRTIEADLIAAQTAQESLLPRDFPSIPGMEFAAVFVPSQYVGGDIYNVIQVDDKHLALYHIDVSGHGVPAALFSVGLNQFLTRELLASSALREEGAGASAARSRVRSPEEIVAMLDRENMFQRHQRFFTMLYLVANVKTGKVVFYRAGHNEPLLVPRDAPPRYLEGGGPLIGFQLPRSPGDVQEIQLQPGDRLIIYSDGINEAKNPEGDQYGLERMAGFFAKANSAPLQDTFSGLLSAVRQFSKSDNFEDDVSMIGFTWNPPPGKPASEPASHDWPGAGPK